MLYAYSMLSSTATTLILGILFLFLSKQSGKLYMSFWGYCWLIYSFVFLLDYFGFRYPDTWTAYLPVRQSLLLLSSWVFLLGTCRFFQVKIMRVATVAFALSLTATILSIFITPLYSFTLVPNIIISASLLIWSGCMFISYSWTQNLPEKLAASFLIILWAFFINNFGFAIDHAMLAITTYYTCIGIITVLMLLLMIIHFKKAHFLDNKQASRFRLLVENSDDCMFLFNYRNADFEYVSPNINKTIGVSAGQLYESPERFFDHLETSENNRHALSIFSNPVDKPDKVVLSLVRRGQIVQWSEMHYIPIFDDMGNVTSVEGIIRDITQTKLSEEKLRETEKAKDDFIENISHEIRTPITLIRGYTESLRDGVVPRESSPTYLNMIISKTIMLNSLLDDLKQLSHFTSQNLEYKFYEVSALNYFQNAFEQCRYHVEQSRHEFSSSLDLPPGLIIIADPGRIMQVITNLINNAVRHTPPQGHIAIECHTEATADDVPLNDNFDNTLPDGMIVFSVSDSGSGIAAEDLPHIFERGYRGEIEKSQAEAASSGSGLGLYISQQIISQHSGQISAANRPEGGACFSFYIPYYK